MQTWAKVTLSIVGAGLLAISSTYTANQTAPVMGYVAAVSGAIGMYLVGLFQTKP